MRPFSTEQIVTKLRQAEVELGRGLRTPQVCKKLGISEQTYYRWRKEYGGLGLDQAKRLKALEQENLRLKLGDRCGAGSTTRCDRTVRQAIVRPRPGRSDRSGRTNHDVGQRHEGVTPVRCLPVAPRSWFRPAHPFGPTRRSDVVGFHDPAAWSAGGRRGPGNLNSPRSLQGPTLERCSSGVDGAGSARTEGARRASGVGADGAAVGAGALAPGQRWSASRKRDVVLRLLRGESLDTVSREVGVELYRLEAWQARALAGLELGLKEQAGEPLANRAGCRQAPHWRAVDGE